MVVIHPTNIVASREQIHNLTHYVCIPLITALSRPVLQSSLELLRDNPASASIPLRAFVPLNTLHLNMGIGMSLPTPGRFGEAEKLLRSLDLNSLTRELSPPSFEARSIREKFIDIERSLSLSSAAPMTRPLPLHLTLRGLRGAPLGDQDIMVKVLSAQCYESTSRVRHLCNNLAIIFAAAGLHNPYSARPSHRIALQTTGLPLGNVSLIRTAFIRPTGLVPSREQPGKFRNRVAPEIDSRDLVRIFRDFVWADNIRLDRLSICPLGLHRLIKQEGLKARLCEDFSVPLP